MDRMLTWFETHATPTGVVELAALAPDERKELEEVLGLPALESAIIATRPNRVLWTDDAVGAFVATQRLGARRIWTQAAFGWSADEGRVAQERRAVLSARLIGWGYGFTSANDGILRAAGKLADWDASARPLKEALAYFALPEVRPKDALALGAFLVRDAYRNALMPGRRRAVLISVLDALGKRTDLKDRAFDEFAAALPGLFGLDLLGCDDAVKSLAAWRAGKHRLVRL